MKLEIEARNRTLISKLEKLEIENSKSKLEIEP